MELRRKDGGRLWIDMHRPAAGFARLQPKTAAGVICRAGVTVGKAQTLRAIRRWYAGEIDHMFPPQTGDLALDFDAAPLAA